MKRSSLLFFIGFIGLALAACTVVPSSPDSMPYKVSTAINQFSASSASISTATQTPNTDTPSPSSSLSTPNPQGTPTPETYAIQAGSPKYIQNFSRPDLGCQVQTIAGQIFDRAGNPVQSIVVNVQGTLNGKTIHSVALSGSATAYGPGGYEIDLGTTPVASTRTLAIWLSDLKGNLLSDRFPFDTYTDCEKNLILLNFQPELKDKLYLPLVKK